MEQIIYPIPPKYFVAWTEATPAPIVAYGKIESDQCMTTGLINLETFIDEAPYKARLLEFGITLIDPALIL